MSRKSEYGGQASQFADRLSHLLNNTITHGIRITSVLADEAETGWVGYRVSRHDFVGRLIPAKTGQEAASCYVQVGMTLQLDPDISRLVVSGSTMGLYCDDDFESMAFHYDFSREPDNPYPTAHFQVAGTNQYMEEICNRAGAPRTLERLHFPVGGKRFRPSVEDLVEFLIVEQIARPHDGWEDILREHRAEWEQVQLRAVVRRDPDTAAAELERQGYRVAAPRYEGTWTT